MHRVVRTYEKTQVELHGQYSVARLRDFDAYCSKTSNLRVFWVLASMPLPCLAVITLIEMLPMQAPSKGLGHNALFFLRSAIVAFTITATILEQCRRFVPTFNMRISTLIVMALITTCATAGCEVGLAYLIAFPLPFTIIMSVPARFGTIGVLFAVLYGRILLRDRAARQQLLVCTLGLTAQVSLIIIYPLYNFAFQNLSSTGQTAFTLLLPLIKVLSKNWIAHEYRSMEDVKPEMVIFNSEIFHALYVSVCMQNSRSGYTTVLIMAMDFAQFVASMSDVTGMLRVTTALRKLLASELPGYMMVPSGSCLIVEPALFILDHDTELQRHASLIDVAREIEVALQRNGNLQLKSSETAKSSRLKSKKVAMISTSRVLSAPHEQPQQPAGVRSPSVMDLVTSYDSQKRPAPSTLESMHMLIQPSRTATPLPSATDVMLTGGESSSGGDVMPVGNQTSVEKVKYVQQILQVLHVTEFLLLIEFIEVLIPVIYCTYLFA